MQLRISGSPSSNRSFILGVASLWFCALLLCALPRSSFAQTWVLVWGDDFDGPARSAPDPRRWTYDIGTGFGTGEIEFTTDSRDNSYIDGNGNLVIKAIIDKDGRITSARLKTKRLFDFQFGKIEARIKLPYSQGMWPAFWMLGNNIDEVRWPACGEIDIMENIGRERATVHGTLHGYRYAQQGLGRPYSLPEGEAFHTDYHIFGAIWSPYLVQIYVDDRIYATLTPASLMYGAGWAFSDHPFFIIVNLAVGGLWAGRPDETTVWPQLMYVDYVHVYQWTPGPAGPTELTGAALSNSQIQLQWRASTDPDVTYNVFRSQTLGFEPNITNLIASDINTTGFTDTELQPNTVYYYRVTATGLPSAESDPSNEVGVPTPVSGTNGGPVRINAGGNSVGNYIGDTDFSDGNTNASTSQIDTSAVVNPAPAQVYQTERWGPSTYTIASLTPGARYTLRLHFCETIFDGPNRRTFHVRVNGQPVLTEYDVFARAGAKNKALVEEFAANADSNGQLLIEFLRGAHNNPSIRGIELIPMD